MCVKEGEGNEEKCKQATQGDHLQGTKAKDGGKALATALQQDAACSCATSSSSAIGFSHKPNDCAKHLRDVDILLKIGKRSRMRNIEKGQS